MLFGADDRLVETRGIGSDFTVLTAR